VFKLGKHTSDVMDGRSIILACMEHAVAAPDRVTDDPTDPTLIRSYDGSETKTPVALPTSLSDSRH
jgi:hypothetical protein